MSLRLTPSSGAMPILSFALAPFTAVLGRVRSRAAGLWGTARGSNHHARSQVLEAEIARARRYEQQVSIVVLRAEEPAPITVIGRGESAPRAERVWVWATPTLKRLESILCGSLRENDVMTYDAALGFVVALPQTDSEGAQDAAERLRALVHQGAALRLRIGTATFPGDALVLEDLVAVACGDPPLRSGRVAK